MHNLDEQIKQLNLEGLTNAEIAKKLKIGTNTVHRKTKRLNVKPISKNIPKLSLEQYREFYNKGFNDRKVSKITGIGQSTIHKYRTKLGLPYLGHTYEETTLSYEEEQIIIGGLLGDMYMSIPKLGRNASGMFAHSNTQKEYCHFKYEKLKRFCKKPFDTYQDDKRTKKRYFKTVCNLYVNPVFNSYYNSFYPDGKKIVPENLIEKLDCLGLAIWFMDDGSRIRNAYSLATNSFSEQDVFILIKFLKTKFNINASRHKSGVIYIKSESYIKFRNLVEPYIVDCLKYKL